MIKFKKRIARKAFRITKDVYQKVFAEARKHKNILFVLGCQRSGTTLMTQIFDKDLKVKVYGEFSELSSLDQDKIRLNPLDLVEKEIYRNKVASIVLKPLVESQNTNRLLNFFEESRGIWMFRFYKDVVSSNLKLFGLRNGINNLRPIVHKTPGNWRADGISQNTFKLIQKYFSEDMHPQDAAALFWYVRNILFFELSLQQNHRVILCKYEDLVTSPLKTIKSIYSFSRFVFPGERIISGVHAKSVNKGQKVVLTTEIEELCNKMQEKLNDAYKEQRENL